MRLTAAAIAGVAAVCGSLFGSVAAAETPAELPTRFEASPQAGAMGLYRPYGHKFASKNDCIAEGNIWIKNGWTHAFNCRPFSPNGGWLLWYWTEN